MNYNYKDKYYLDNQDLVVKNSPVLGSLNHGSRNQDLLNSEPINSYKFSRLPYKNQVKRFPSIFSTHLSPLILLSCAIIVLYFSVTGSHGLLYLEKLNNELIKISDKNTMLIENAFDLSYKIEAINEGGLYLEKKAREDFGLFKEGETVYLFQDLKKSAGVSPNTKEAF